MTEKPKIACADCGRTFGDENALHQHRRDRHGERGRKMRAGGALPPLSAKKRAARDVFECIADDDMPDGAYFALAAEFGLDPTDLID